MMYASLGAKFPPKGFSEMGPCIIWDSMHTIEEPKQYMGTPKIHKNPSVLIPRLCIAIHPSHTWNCAYKGTGL